MQQYTLQELCSMGSVDINHALNVTQEPFWCRMEELLRSTSEVTAIRNNERQNDLVCSIAENYLVAKEMLWLKAFRDVAKGIMENNRMDYHTWGNHLDLLKHDGLYYHTWGHHIEYMEQFVLTKLLPFNKFVSTEPYVSQLHSFSYKPFSIDYVKIAFLAVWFHDVVYKAGSALNEEHSAFMLNHVWQELHEKFLGVEYIEQPAQTAILKEACSLIMLTAHHSVVVEDILQENPLQELIMNIIDNSLPTCSMTLSLKVCAGIVLDADLASIADTVRFNYGNELLKLENLGSPSLATLNSLRFVRSLLDRSQIYYQSPELENSARANLSDFIQELEKPLARFKR